MIEIDISSPESIYEQIVSQLGLALIKGDISEGDKLPPIRQLANDLEVNPNTVAKAYQLLEEWKIIETRGRSGSIINPGAKASFENWLLNISKKNLKETWNKILSISPTKEMAKRAWKNAIKELRDE